jgi:hypothetical protein
MSGNQSTGPPRRSAGYVRVGIAAKDNGPPRKVAWIMTGTQGISFGVARATGWGTRYSYLQDGSFLRIPQSESPAVPKRTPELVARYPPINEIKGLLQLSSVDVGTGDRLLGFPFRRKYESVLVKSLNGRASFKLGLLEAGVPQALDTLKKEERHFRLITESHPWILLWNAAGFEAAARV